MTIHIKDSAVVDPNPAKVAAGALIKFSNDTAFNAGVLILNDIVDGSPGQVGFGAALGPGKESGAVKIKGNAGDQYSYLVVVADGHRHEHRGQLKIVSASEPDIIIQ
jgi:hypothetical protein